MSDRGLLLGLTLIPALFGAALVVPGSWMWGVDVLRFLGPWGWGSAVAALAATAALLLPRPRTRAEFALAPPPAAVVAVLAALLIFFLRDRALFVGDALLRVYAVTTGAFPESFFPQAYPLDVFLHWQVPRLLYERWHFDPVLWHRLLGAGEAGLLAFLAVRFAPAAALRGAAALAACALCLFGGWLTLFTGLGKGFTELVVLTLAVGVSGLGVARDGRHRVWLGLLLALALLTHRSALALLPGVAWLLWHTRHAEGGRPRPVVEHLSWLLPVLAVSVQARQLWSSFSALDMANFGLADGAQRGGLLDPLHALDLVQVLLFLLPAAVLFLIPAGGEAKGRSTEKKRPSGVRRRQERYLWGIALPFLAMAVLYLPPQGLFRDYDGLAAAGIAVALVLAHRVGSRLGSSRGRAALAILIWCALPSLWWLMLNANPEAALRRVETLAAGPPLREPLLRAHTWDYLGSVRFDAGDYAASAVAFAHASEVAASPRFLSAWAESARRAGDWEQAERAFGALLERVPEEEIRLRILAHLGLAAAAGRRQEYQSVQHHVDAVLALEPENPRALQLLGWLRAQGGGDAARDGEVR